MELGKVNPDADRRSLLARLVAWREDDLFPPTVRMAQMADVADVPLPPRRAPTDRQADGKRLADARRRVGLTQGEVESRVGLSAIMVCKAEIGEWGVSPRLQVKFAVALGTSVPELFPL